MSIFNFYPHQIRNLSSTPLIEIFFCSECQTLPYPGYFCQECEGRVCERCSKGHKCKSNAFIPISDTPFSSYFEAIEVYCPCLCGESTKITKIQNHIDHCLLKTLSCSLCNKAILYSDIYEHCLLHFEEEEKKLFKEKILFKTDLEIKDDLIENLKKEFDEKENKLKETITGLINNFNAQIISKTKVKKEAMTNEMEEEALKLQKNNIKLSNDVLIAKNLDLEANHFISLLESTVKERAELQILIDDFTSRNELMIAKLMSSSSNEGVSPKIDIAQQQLKYIPEQKSKEQNFLDEVQCNFCRSCSCPICNSTPSSEVINCEYCSFACAVCGAKLCHNNLRRCLNRSCEKVFCEECYNKIKTQVRKEELNCNIFLCDKCGKEKK